MNHNTYFAGLSYVPAQQGVQTGAPEYGALIIPLDGSPTCPMKPSGEAAAEQEQKAASFFQGVPECLTALDWRPSAARRNRAKQ